MSRMRDRKGRRSSASPPFWGRAPLWAYFVAFSLLALGVGGGLYAYVNLPRSSPAVSEHVAKVGELAAGFSLANPYGQSHTLTPGDGRAHLLVFYMGYF